MTDAPEANRAQCRRGTGPRSPVGKARSASNSLRHGFSARVLSGPALTPEVAGLARRIAGQKSSPQLFGLACRVAEAQIDVQRVREHFRRLMDRAEKAAPKRLARPEPPPKPLPQGTARAALFNKIERLASRKPRLPGEAQAQRIAVLVHSLAGLDRYERRARSRLKMAIRAYDEASSFF